MSEKNNKKGTRNEVVSIDSGFNEMIEKMTSDNEETHKPFVRAASEEPRAQKPRRNLFSANKNIFMYLEQHGMDPKKPPNWWIKEEDDEQQQSTVQKTLNRAISVPSIKTSESYFDNCESVDNDNVIEDDNNNNYNTDRKILKDFKTEPKTTEDLYKLCEGDSSTCSSDADDEDDDEDEYEDTFEIIIDKSTTTSATIEDKQQEEEEEVAEEVESTDETINEDKLIVVEHVTSNNNAAAAVDNNFEMIEDDEFETFEPGMEASEVLPDIDIPTDNKASIRPGTDSRESNQIELLPEKNQKKISNIIRELIEVEINYVEKLGRGIQIYVNEFDSCTELPPALQGKKYHVFGNIERIHDFHRDTLLPSITNCSENVLEIANVFYDYILQDRFYSYVLYGLNQPKAERICFENKVFFDGLAKKAGDKLGINSFLLEPIQRLPRYNLLLTDIIRSLANFDGEDGIKNVKSVVTAYCKAAKQMEFLLNTINESLSLIDIEECYEPPPTILSIKSALFGVWPDMGKVISPDGLEFCLYLNKKCIFNVLDQGKFKRMDEFQMNDSAVNRRFYGKLFLFEQSLLLTELMDSKKLQYRSHALRCDIQRINTDNKNFFELIVGHRTLVFSDADALLKIQDWIKLLAAGGKNPDGVITMQKQDSLSISFRDTDSRRASMFRRKDSGRTSRANKRSKSQPRIVSLISTTSTESKSSISSEESYDLGNTRWYVKLEPDPIS